MGMINSNQIEDNFSFVAKFLFREKEHSCYMCFMKSHNMFTKIFFLEHGVPVCRFVCGQLFCTAIDSHEYGYKNQTTKRVYYHVALAAAAACPDGSAFSKSSRILRYQPPTSNSDSL